MTKTTRTGNTMTKTTRTDNTMAKTTRTDNTMAKTTRTGNTMAKRMGTKRQIMIYKALHRKLKIEQRETYKNGRKRG